MDKSLLIQQAEGLSGEAGEWLARMQGAPSAEIRQAFLLWLCTSPSHCAALLIKEAEQIDLAGQNPVPQLEQLPDTSEDHSISISTSDRGRYVAEARFRMAPILMITALAVAGYLLWPTRKAPPPTVRSWSYSHAGVYDLGNASLMVLKESSDAQVTTFEGNGRQVVLTGTASFSGKHNASSPLRVVTGNAISDVMGTKFQVRGTEDTTTVTVEDGSVRLAPICSSSPRAPSKEPPPDGPAPTTSSATLTAGQIGVITGTGCSASIAVRSLNSPNARNDVISTPDVVYLDHITVRAAVEMFNRSSSQQIVVTDPVLAEERIGGTFRPRDPTSLVEFLKINFRAAVTHRTNPDGSDTIVISGASQR